MLSILIIVRRDPSRLRDVAEAWSSGFEATGQTRQTMTMIDFGPPGLLDAERPLVLEGLRAGKHPISICLGMGIHPFRYGHQIENDPEFAAAVKAIEEARASAGVAPARPWTPSRDGAGGAS